jgi:hypothetical protein
VTPTIPYVAQGTKGKDKVLSCSSVRRGFPFSHSQLICCRVSCAFRLGTHRIRQRSGVSGSDEYDLYRSPP